MANRLQELREIYHTRFHTIPHTKTFGELLDIAEKLNKTNNELREENRILKIEPKRRDPNGVQIGRMQKEINLFTKIVSDCIILLKDYSNGKIKNTNDVHKAIYKFDGYMNIKGE